MIISNKDKELAYVAQDLMLQIELMDNRDYSIEPLRADEFTVVIPRNKYRSLCEYALEGIRLKAI